MAIYHFSGTIISRSQGRSAVACAAYRAGEKLYDERYQKVQDYSKRKDVVHRNILTPNNAPEWTKNRDKLWNEVEKIEPRKDSQLAREFNFSLPRELSLEENIKLTEKFVQRAFVDRGMIADLAIHVDQKSDGAYYHAHVMLTTRAVSERGFGQKARTWNSKDLLMEWRQEWAEHCNRYLALNGLDLRVDHRTLADQHIPLEPQHKIGPEASKEASGRFEDHQRIARENGERLQQDPQIALTAITQQQSTFTLQDLARFINRQTADAEQFTQVLGLVKSQPNIVKLGLDEKQQERFSTQEIIALESKMLEQAKMLFDEEWHVLRRSSDKSHLSLTTEQQTAFSYITNPGDLKCLVGYAGTGKSYLLGEAREQWEQQGFRVQGVTLSGIAAESLEAGSSIGSRTLASRSYYWDRGEQLLTQKDIVVVDEAGMLGSRQLARIIDEVTKAKAKVVLVGDPQQLQAIEAGAAFRAISEQVGFVELTEVRIQQKAWQKEATKELATRKVANALNRYARANHIHGLATKELAKSEMINMWNDVRLQQPVCSQIMLAYTRDDVLDLNQMARTVKHQQGELGMEQSFSTFRGERNFAINDRIYFLKNDRNLGVMNGSLGTITNINPKALTIELDNTKKEVVVDFDLYNHIDYGYAATIHKSQGVTVDRSYLLASKYLDAHATYVGMTRHRESVDLFYSKEEFPKHNDLVKSLNRDRAKDVSLDYAENKFAVNYGMQVPEEPAKQQERAVTKESFPFRNKFSSLQEFTVLNTQDKGVESFNVLRAELAKQFAGKTQKELEQILFSKGNLTTQQEIEAVKQFEELLKQSRTHLTHGCRVNLNTNNLDLSTKQQQIIKQHNRHTELMLNNNLDQPKYTIVDQWDKFRGIVGKNITLADGRSMIEILVERNQRIKLVEDHLVIKTELGRKIELSFDQRGVMVGIKTSEMLARESQQLQEQQHKRKELALERQRAATVELNKQQELNKELSRGDRGIER